MSSTLDTQHDLAVEKAPARAAPPPMYQVLLLNDDYTPMEFVVKVLQKFFNKNHEDATRIMLQVHHEGRGVCGVYPRDVAATRIAQVAQYAGAPASAAMRDGARLTARNQAAASDGGAAFSGQ